MIVTNSLLAVEASYAQWIAQNEQSNFSKAEINDKIAQLSYTPCISILVPVYNVDEIWLRKCLDSVLAQWYPYWELCIAEDCSNAVHIKPVLQEYAMKDSRIKVVYRTCNGHISAASNSALELATGEYVALLDHDDEIAVDALYEVAKTLYESPTTDMIYSDEDKIDEQGMRSCPFFKPDWSPDTFLSQMYTCHLGVYRTKLVREIGGFRAGFEGSQDYDLVLRLTEKTKAIQHIPRILYHWRTIPQSTASGSSAKDYANAAGIKSITEALHRRGEDAWVEGEDTLYRVHYRIQEQPLISIIIPSRNMAATLSNCLSSIFKKSLYTNFEVLLVDNGSDEHECLQLMEKWGRKEPARFRILPCDIPFNYPKLNNYAAAHARGELITLLNNDIEVISENWLEEMAGYALRPSIGAVGAKLHYPDGSIQHAGVVLGIGGVAGHSHKHYPESATGYFSQLTKVANYSAVTGACVMVKKKVYEEVGGLEETLSIAFNDVDFCLKIREKGYYNVLLPHVRLLHHESKSRGYEDTPEKVARFGEEIAIMKTKWDTQLQSDPFYSRNLTLEHEDYSIRIKKENL